MSLAVPGTAVTVGTAATQLYSAPTTGYFRDLVVTNGSTVPVYLGTSTMGTANTSQYFAVPATQYVLLGGQVETVYGIVASGSATVMVSLASAVSVT